MSLGEWSILMFAVGVILLVAELFLPAHGLILVSGALAVIVGVVLCFFISPWLGVTAMVGTAAGTPVLFAALLKLAPRTRVGRELVLPPVEAHVPPALVQIGACGIAVSELRPMGYCEFDGQRVEAMSELGMIRAGTKVQVVSVNNRQPTVRAV